jgi:flagellar biosynthesis GTPase FlhF
MPSELAETDIPNPADARKSPDYVDNGIDDLRLLPEGGGIASVLHPRFVAITIKYDDGAMLIVPIEQLQAPREPGVVQIVRYRRHAKSGKIFPLIWRGTSEQIMPGYDASKGAIAFNRDVTPTIMALYDRAIVRGALEAGKLAAALWSIMLGVRGAMSYFTAAELATLMASEGAAAGRLAREEAMREVRERAAEAERRAAAEAARKAARSAAREAQEEAKRKAAREAYELGAKERAEREAQREAEQEAQRRTQQDAQRSGAPEAQRRAEREAQQEGEREARREAGREAARAERSAKGLGSFARLVGKRVREVFGEVRFRGLKSNRPLRDLTDAEIRDAFSGSPFKLTNHVIMRLRDPRTANLGVETLNDLARNLNSSLMEDADEGLLRLVGPDRRLFMLMDPNTNTLVTLTP